ncbi:cadherin-23-like [Argopecten irradians]|uniref:cadherin-23-like n=1 Tax=Argopecten irradians TaxID=31199 RepID=UPI00371C66C7
MYRGDVKGCSGFLVSILVVLFCLTTCEGASPVWTTPSTATSISISENEAVSTSVYQLTATDADGDSITYSLSTGSGFTVIGDVVYTNTAFDYETTQSYALQFSATDGVNTVTSPTLTVTITDYNDNTPTFSPAIYSNSIPEGSASGTSIAALTCTDADSGTNGNCGLSIQSGDTSGMFTISGTILQTTGTATDYESLSAQNYIYSLVVIATDTATAGSDLTGTAYVYVTITGINDNTPSISGTTPSSISVVENSAVGTTVATIQASDADDGDDGVLTYSIIGGNSEAKFGVGTTTGEIYLTQALDYETTTSYSLTVQATDGGTPTDSATAAVTVTVTGVNDNTPACPSSTYTFSLAETSASGTTVTTLACTDADGDTITYSISSGNSESCFSISTADLVTACTLDYDTGSQSYTLGIDASDGTTSSSITVYISLTAENDNTPAFASNPTVTLAESTSIGTAVTTYTAADSDASPHDMVSYSITGVTNSGSTVFAIDSTSGSITLSSSLDYEATTSYVITVEGVDGGGTTATGSVTVSVTDVNDNSPIFSPSAYTVEIAESTSASTVIATMTCADADTGDTISYAIASGNSGSKFSISGTGVISLAATIDYDTETTFYTLTVEADDTTNTATATVKITVTGTNEGTPAFASNPTVNLAESSSVSTAVTTYAATDTDASPHDITTYAITTVTNAGSSYFTIDATTGSITLAKTLDYDTTTSYEITVTATDGGGLVGTGTVTLSVTNVNDNTPACPSSSYTFTLAETSASGTTVTTLACTDGDTGDTLAYTITSGNGDGCFALASASGILTTACTLDYDTGSQSYSLAVEVSDGSLSSTATVDVVLTAENDNNPTFASNPTVSLAESTSIGTAVTTYAASDSDLSPHDVVSYAISAVTNSGTSVFSIDSTSGSITLSSSLDYETTTDYVITVVATDGGGTTVTGSVTVSVTDVNDNSPIFSPSAYTVEIAESTSASTVIATMTCADADTGDTISYAIASGNSGSKFSISGTGVISLAATIDYDTETTFYTLTVEADDTTNTATATVKITVTGTNEGTPAFASNPTVSLAESSSVSTAVTTYAATDTDASPHDITTYAITTVTNSGSSYFTIDATTGSITLAKTLDYDTTTIYEITVTATDGGGLVGTGTVTLSVTNVNDNTPACPSSSYTFTLAETSASGTTVTTLACTDGDTGDTLAYTITSGNGDGCFALASASGILTTACTLDYDTGSQSYSLAVEVSDGSLSSTATVDVVLTAENDNNPTFASNPTVSLAESTSIGTAVTTYAASDSDLSPHDVVSYAISAVTNSGTSVFSIDSTSGSITLSSSLDYETTTDYVITVVATDGGGTTVTGSVTVSVTDVNDNSPIFSPSAYTVEIAESTSASTVIATMTCADADTGDTISYAIASGNSGSKFSISGTGVISLAATIDYDTETTFYTLTVEADDTTNTATATVKITVTGTNEGTPAFASNPTVSLAESSSVSTAVTTYAATDTDASPHDITTYAITTVTNSGSSYFTIDATTGSITLAKTLDYDTTTIYEITVTATDGGGLVGTGTVTLSVTNVNDNTPACPSSSYTFTLAETSASGTTVTTLACTDGDTGDTLAYTITSGNGDGCFALASASGILTTACTLDYDTGSQSYSLAVEVSDGSLSSTATVDVVLTAENDNNPTFASNPTVSLAESTSIGTAVTTYAASDSDLSPHDVVSYAISAVTNSGTSVFSIDSTSGSITLSSSLDYETTTDYVITVVATDGGGTTVTGSVTVSVTDVNDNSPIFSPSAYTVEIAESTSASTVIATMTCADADTGDTISYAIASGNSGSKFSISGTGVISLAATIDYDTETTFYTLTVEADDTTNTATATVKITVTGTNEGTPAFASNPTVSLAESSSVSTAVTTYAATDTDASPHDITTYAITTVTNSGSSYFTIDATTGSITLAKTLDYDTTTIYEITVTATDGGGLVGTGTVTLSVTNVNDNTPACPSSSYTFTLAETSASGTTVTTLACTDGDTGDTLAYTITSGNGDGCFALASASGILTTACTLDYDTGSQSYSLAVEVSDGSLSSTATVDVVLTAENDNNPTFASNPTVSLAESTSIGTAVTTYAASDSDLSPHDVVSYAISAVTNSGTSVFSIDSTSGSITLSSSLDYETTTDYVITVVATDGGGTTVTGSVTVSVTDVNDNSPIFSPSAYTVEIAESTSASTVIATMTCADADTGDTISYAIASGNSGSKFSISGTGVISLAATIDYDTETTFYTLTVEADDTTNTATATVKITVTGTNEGTPAFASNPTVSLAESSSVSTAVTTYAATDTDASPHDITTYAITTVTNSGSSYFTIDATTGSITLAKTLDYDTTTIYEITVTATDGGGLVGTGTVTLSVTNVNDNTPACPSSSYTFTLAETSASGTTVTTLACTDGDTGDTLAYTITSGNGDGCFALASASGILTTACTLDYDTGSQSYSLAVEVSDGTLSSTATVDVVLTAENDNNPTFASNPTVSLAESTSIGTAVTTYAASDSDLSPHEIVSYSITTVTNSGSTVFSIDSTSGSITLSSSLDYETTTDYVITVVATDGGGTTVTGSVTVSVTDVNDNSPIFSPSAYDVEMAESTAAAATVVTMTCSDADTGDTISYAIVSGDASGKFSVTAAGEITLAATIDYDTETTFYTLTVEADDTTNTATATVKITVTGTNEGTPVFASNPTVSLAESSSVSTAVTTYAATDTDASPHDITTYAITTVTNTGSPYFNIDTSTGSITLAQALDYETTTSYEITVTATDGGGLVVTGTVTVSVTDVNDNIPVCSPSAYSSTVSESSATGVTVATLACSDGDTGDTITYSVVSGNVGSDFAISAAGDVTLANALDYDAGTQEYTILFGVSDGTTISTATVAVTVGAANEATPTFASNPSTTLAEDTGTGTAVMTYTAADADASPHNIVNYDITAVTNGGTNYFTIDETSGNIQLAQSLDYESTTSYELTVVATDGGGSTGTGTVTVAVTNVNDNTPICTPFAHVLTVPESTATSTAVISDLSCSDGDAGTTLTYTMTQNPDNKFAVSVSGSTASLIVNAALDYETTTFYNLQVTVKDGGAPELTATVTVDVNVGAVDEGAPVFTSSGTYALSAAEDTAVGSTLVTVTATDSVDTGDPISYAFVATYSMFELDTNAGTILLVTSMDYETATNHQLLVTAYDGTNYVTATVTITVNDVNEVAVFGSSTYTPTFAENQAIGTTLVQVAATDGDASTFGTITYSISSGDGASYFTIDSSTGAITASVVIDYEANQYFSLIVQAVDGVPALTAQCLVQITMTDENDNTPTFNPTTYSVTLSEDSAVTTTVTTVSATDADSVNTNNNVFEYTTTSSVPFTVGTTTGEITTNAVLDRETTASYEMVILATDKGPTPLTGTSTVTISLIDVNDNDPSISGTYDTTIDEDTTVNTVVFTITATDLDYQENSQLSYSFNSGNTNTDFSIEVGTGIIQTANALDRETTASYTLEVYVVDNGATPRTASVTCTVTIGDLNDNTPAWTAAPYTFAVDENVATGTNVGTIAATDADTGVNSAISYSIIGYWSGGSNPVTIDTSTGVITTSASLDRESVDTYVIWCRVQDSGTPVLSSDTNVTITINDLNDNDPTFASTTYTATVTENTSVGTSITTMAATDADTGVNAVIVYSFDTSTTAGARADIYLTIGSSTGLVEVRSSIDRETDASFTVVVLAVDTGTTPRTGSTTLTVNVGDENDNSPIFSPTYYNSEVPYTGSCNPTILTLTATDADEGANAQLYYYFTTSNSDFTMDASTGAVTRATTLSSGKIYTTYGYSHDGGSPQLQTSTSATMRIDAYTPSLVVISYYLGISKSTYEATESTFISQLDAVYQVTYSSASVKRWCIVESTGSSIIVHMYVLQDNTTDSISNIASQKLFLSASSAQGFVATDTAGTPSSSVIGTSWDPYAIEKIVLYETTTAESSTPWIETATGIAVTTVCAVIGVACITLTVIMIVKYCRGKPTATNAEAPRAEILEPNNSNGSKDTNSKNSNKSWSEKPRPPPYSREGRREQAKAAAAASALTSKNPNKSAFVSEPGGDINSWQKSSDFIVTNREFDGRAVDQASGQVYEYNTKTNERQWIKTRGGTPVKIDIGKSPDGLDI